MKKIVVALLSASVLAAVHLGFFQHILGLSGGQAIALAILLIAAIFWTTEIVPLFVTSFVILFLEVAWLLPVLAGEGVELNAAVFYSPFFSDIIILFLGGFTLSHLMHRYAIDRRAAGVIIRKMGGNQRLLLVALMGTAAFFSMWMSNTATAAMMFAIVLPIINDLPDNAPYAKALALAIPFSCNLGGMSTPIGTPPNAIAIAYLNQKGVSISFTDWMGLSFPIMLILLIFLAMVLFIVYGIKNDIIEYSPPVEAALTVKHWAVVFLFGATALGWMTTGFHGVPIAVVSLVPILVAFGTGLLGQNDFRSLSWDILFMMGGGLALGEALSRSGLSDAVIEALPTAASPFVLLLLFALVASVMTTFMSNTATANLLIPVAVALPGEAGIVALVIAFACSSSMALPVSTPPNAIAFSSGVIVMKDMLRLGIIVTFFAVTLIMTFGRFFWAFLGY